jgi:hypothetical protein
MTTVWIYTRGPELIVFDSEETAQAWFKKHDPEGVAFEYPVLSSPRFCGDVPGMHGKP